MGVSDDAFAAAVEAKGGYQRSTLRLVYADPEFEGLEVRCRRVTVAETVQLMMFQGMAPGDLTGSLEKVTELADLLSRPILSWNLLDHAGEPVPVTPDALLYQDVQLLLHTAGALLTAAVGVSPPLSQPSSSGELSLEESIPMDVSSPNPPTSPEPD